jgi:predicted permease
MRDFRTLVRSRLKWHALPIDREEKIVEEWAAQLEDIYDGLRAAGQSDADAWSNIERQLAESDAFRDLRESQSGNRPPLLAASPASADTDTEPSLWARPFRGIEGDIRAAVRLLRASPGFSATVILTLAFCLGANAAIFAVVNGVLLRPLPVPEADRIVGMGDVYPTITPNDILSNDVPSYFDRREALTALEEQAMFTFWFDTIAIDGIPNEVRGMRVTPSLFRVLRVPPAIGRAFIDAEGEPGNDQKVILSHGLWQRLYGGDPDVVGKTLRLAWTGNPYTIVGVMPRDFSFFDFGYPGHAGNNDGVQFWIPLAFTPAQKSESGRTRYGFFHIGRLRADATVAQVQDQLNAVHAATVERFPQFRFDELGMYSQVTRLQEALTRRVRPTLYLLWAGAGFVLLIGVINIGNLALARASGRRRELATRLALGASKGQMTRQLIIEALLPAVLGGAIALAIGTVILAALATTGLADLPNAGGVRLDVATVIFVLAASIIVGLLIGTLPAASAGGGSLGHVLAEGSRFGTRGRSATLFRRGLVAIQVALSVVLLVAATLSFSSFRYLLGLDAGFTPSGVVTATIFPPPSRYPDTAAVVRLLDEVLERVRTIPGVQSVGLTSNIALSGFESPSTVSAADAVSTDETVVPSVVSVTPGYFETMSTPLVRGRHFLPSDREESLRVAIVDERLAERLWPGQDPLGKAIYRGDFGPSTIVGVVRHVRLEGLTGSIDAIGAAYFPHTQSPSLPRLRWIAIKSVTDPAAVVRALRSALLPIDPDLPLGDVQTMSERTAHNLVSQRLAMTLAAMFAVTALLLSLLGIYGVLSHLVTHRSREIGIRMALGSSLNGVLRLVLSEGVVLIGLGLLLGLTGAVAIADTLKNLVFGVQPTDPVLLASVALATGCAAFMACLLPARRAARVNPVDVLSAE